MIAYQRLGDFLSSHEKGRENSASSLISREGSYQSDNWTLFARLYLKISGLGSYGRELRSERVSSGFVQSLPLRFHS